MCKRPMELADTAEMMMSEDYKERFRAEYGQVAIRHQKLKAMLEKWDKGELNFTPTCPRSTYDLQIKAMATISQFLKRERSWKIFFYRRVSQ